MLSKSAKILDGNREAIHTVPEAQSTCTVFTKNFRKTKKNPD